MRTLSTEATIASLLIASFAVSSCAAEETADDEPVSTGATAEPEAVPAFEESAEQLDPEIIEATDATPSLDDYDDEESFREAVSQAYVEARLSGDDPVIAEAVLAELYTDEALDRAADRWTRQVEVAPTDFVQPHLGTMEYEAVSFNHGEVENSKAVHVTWEGETCDEDDHHAMVIIEVEEVDGEFKVSDFTHRTGCTCGTCLA